MFDAVGGADGAHSVGGPLRQARGSLVHAKGRSNLVRIALVACVVLGMLVASVANAGAQKSGKGGKSKGEIKVGFLVPLSGNFASTGKNMQRGLELYLAQSKNKLGGYDVNLSTVDEGAGAASAVPGAQKLIKEDRVQVATGVVSSASAIAVFPQFEAARIPVVFGQGYPYAEPNPNASEFMYNVGSTVPPYGGSMGAYLATLPEAKTKGVYFMASDYSQGHLFTQVTQDAFKAAGGKVVGESFPPLGTTLDFQPYLSAAKSASPGAVWAFFAGADAQRFMQQYKSFGLQGTIPLYSSSSLLSGPNLAAAGDAAVGIVTNGFYSLLLNNPENQKFIADYTKKFGEEPDQFAVQQWDAMYILDQALAKVKGDLSGDKIAAAIGKVGELKTARGTWHLDKKSHVPVHEFYLFEVKRVQGNINNTLVDSMGFFDPVTGKALKSSAK